MTKAPVTVLIVDDSKVTRLSLVYLLESDPQIRVIGVAENGQGALDFVGKTLPDVILMDIHMPVMDGLEATRRIMETRPVPIIICSATTEPGEIASTFRLMEVGAVACLQKPLGRERDDFPALAANLIQTVKLMSEVKVVRRWPRSRFAPGTAHAPNGMKSKAAPGGLRFIGIGASTGGPPVLQAILAGLPKGFPLPILVVQHIASGFLPGLAEWLSQSTGFAVQIASHGIDPLPGHVYLAPDGLQMGLDPGGRILLSRETAPNGLRPAISHLFRSLAEECGPAAVGILLTGMGKDGAAELKLMRDKGAVTIAQDRESSVVHGMPGEAIALNAAAHVASADQIAPLLLTLANPRNGKGD